MTASINVEWTRITVQRMAALLPIQAVRETAGLIGTPDEEVKDRLKRLFSANEIIGLANTLHVTPSVVYDETNDNPSTAREGISVKLVPEPPAVRDYAPAPGKMYRTPDGKAVMRTPSGSWAVILTTVDDSRYPFETLEEI